MNIETETIWERHSSLEEIIQCDIRSEVTVMTRGDFAKAANEVAADCIRLQCNDCAKGHDVLDFPKDNNLWHRNGNPCRAYRLRRFYNLLGALNN